MNLRKKKEHYSRRDLMNIAFFQLALYQVKKKSSKNYKNNY